PSYRCGRSDEWYCCLSYVHCDASISSCNRSIRQPANVQHYSLDRWRYTSCHNHDYFRYSCWYLHYQCELYWWRFDSCCVPAVLVDCYRRVRLYYCVESDERYYCCGSIHYSKCCGYPDFKYHEVYDLYCHAASSDRP